MAAINLETRFFLISILWGIILVLVYDMILVLRRIVPHNKIVKFFEDVVFWIVSGFLIFKMMYQVNEGKVRSFAILGVCLGMFIVQYSISDYIVIYLSRGIKTVFRLVKKLIQFVLKPVRFIWKRIKWIGVFFGKKLKGPLKLPKKALKKIWKTVTIALVKK